MPPSRIPSLDGIRAVSIALVIAGHAYQGATHESPHTPLWLIVGNAGLGVEIFFVISGYLITTLLLKEHARDGSISLRGFYLRRSFRILPALWFFLGVVAALAATGAVTGVTGGAFVSALSFVTNYSPWANSEVLAHTWSLSVEEQFYLLWPAALVWVLARNGRAGAARLALALVLLAPVLRVATHLAHVAYLEERIYYALHTRMDALMFGCLLALVEGGKRFEALYTRTERWVPLAAAFTLVASPLISARAGGAYIYTVGYSIEGAAIALTMLWLIRNPESVAGRLMNATPIAHIGVVSYSLYLWQELMLKTDFAAARSTAVGLLGTVLAAELSYRLVEGPFLRLRARFERPRRAVGARA